MSLLGQQLHNIQATKNYDAVGLGEAVTHRQNRPRVETLVGYATLTHPTKHHFIPVQLA